MSGWNIIFKPFSELLSNVVDNRGKTCPTAPSGLALIATNCIKNDNLYPVYENVRHVSDETYKTWFRGHPLPRDLIFVTKGTPGRVCLVPSKVDFCIAQDMVAIRADNKKVSPKYLFAALRSAEIQSEIENLHVGSLIPHFKKGDFDKLQIPLPERELQEFIGEQYFTFSAKIDLLHRQNKTLEGLAEALWRKMFVEEAGSGWETTTIGEVVTINGKSLDKEYTFAEIEYLDTGSLTEGRISEYQHLQLKDAPSRARRIVQKNDIVISMVRPIQKHYGILKKVNHNTIVSTGFVVITCIEIDPHFIYVLLTQKEMTEYLDIIAEASTTTYPSLVPSDIAKIDFQMPPTELMQQFSEYAEHVWDKIEENNSQIRTLSRLRDTLLPKLMSGEVRVKL